MNPTAGLRAPVERTPDRRPGSVRRTSHVDMVWSSSDPEERFWSGGGPRAPDGAVALVLRGAARDRRTAPDLSTRVIADASVDAELDAQRRLVSLALDPALSGSDSLLGMRVGPGFRAAAWDLLPDQWSGGPAALLLDDLPVAALIAGYATLRSTAAAGLDRARLTPPGVLSHMLDLCSGWRRGGGMALSISAGDGMPMQDCPPAPVDSSDRDPDGWQAMGSLPPGAMRRRRRIDVAAEDGARSPMLAVDAMFPDTYAEPDGTEVVLHEYRLDARVRVGDMTIDHLRAEPRVLPFIECPWAADSPTALVGSPVGSLRATVGARLTGTASCTHLNDLLRALADVEFLATRVS
ncbi:MAG: DUF2889 domain-containing protein [Acidimicrobiales bacterium]